MDDITAGNTTKDIESLALTALHCLGQPLASIAIKNYI